MPFDPDKYLESKQQDFDPDAYLKKAGAHPVISSVESAVRGAGQGLFGLGDELEGAAKAAIDVASPEYSISDLLNRYREQRDLARKQNELAQQANPKSFLAGELGGGLGLSVIPGLGAAEGATLAAKLGTAAAQGAAFGLGSSKADITKGELDKAARDAIVSGGVSAGISGALSGLPAAFKYLSGKSADQAERLAESATGATRAQAEKFAPDAGRELLDRGVVKFGDSPASISSRAKAMMAQSGDDINQAISSIDQGGASIPSEDVLGAINEAAQRIKQKGAGFADQVRALDKIKEDIAESIGSGPVSLSQLESQKRSFGNVNWMNPDQALAKKQTYRALMDLVEQKATEANPAAAEKFINAKDTYKLLAPIQEAAEKRSLQLNQSPWGGLLDIGSAGAGGMVGGVPGAVATTIGRRLVSPRLKSSAAVGFDQLSKALSAGAGASSSLAEKAPFLRPGVEDYVSPEKAAEDYLNRK